MRSANTKTCERSAILLVTLDVDEDIPKVIPFRLFGSFVPQTNSRPFFFVASRRLLESCELSPRLPKANFKLPQFAAAFAVKDMHTH
jgi:hypothetical protein